MAVTANARNGITKTFLTLWYCSKITQKRIESLKESKYTYNRIYFQNQVQKPNILKATRELGPPVILYITESKPAILVNCIALFVHKK